MTEKKTDKFVVIAEKRVNNAIKAIRLIGNLSNTNNYSYSDEQIKLIFKALESELKHARLRFSTEVKKGTPDFKL